jgi:hypothetical protein
LKEEKEKFESNQDREGDGVCAHVAWMYRDSLA